MELPWDQVSIEFELSDGKIVHEMGSWTEQFN